MVRLPLAHERTQNHKPAGSTAEDLDLRILLVDDMEAVLRTVGQGLAKHGQTVLTALSGEEALRILEDRPVDVVVCDLAMPGMTGWEVGRRIKALCEEKGVTKPAFLLLTGWSDQASETGKIRESGVDSVVDKPVDAAGLLRVIAGLFSEQKTGK